MATAKKSKRQRRRATRPGHEKKNKNKHKRHSLHVLRIMYACMPMRQSKSKTSCRCQTSVKRIAVLQHNWQCTSAFCVLVMVYGMIDDCSNTQLKRTIRIETTGHLATCTTTPTIFTSTAWDHETYYMRAIVWNTMAWSGTTTLAGRPDQLQHCTCTTVQYSTVLLDMDSDLERIRNTCPQSTNATAIATDDYRLPVCFSFFASSSSTITIPLQKIHNDSDGEYCKQPTDTGSNQASNFIIINLIIAKSTKTYNPQWMAQVLLMWDVAACAVSTMAMRNACHAEVTIIASLALLHKAVLLLKARINHQQRQQYQCW